MENQVSEIDWDKILKNFSSHEGTIRSFCKENNISVHQFYYRRRREGKNKKPEFHNICLNEKGINEKPLKPIQKSESMIKIEIGKAKIFIPSEDKSSISSILKEIISIC